MLGRQARLQRGPQPQRHVGVLGGVFGRLVDGDAVEGDARFSGARDVAEVNGLVAQPFLGEVVHAVAAFAGVEHVGNEHGVVVALDLDAALREHQPIVFQVLPDFQDALVLEQRLENFQRVFFLDLIGCEACVEQAIAAAVLFVCKRHVKGFVGRQRERETAQGRLHRVEAGGLGVDRDHAQLMRSRDPFLQAGKRAHAFVFAAIDFLRARGFRARGGERDGGESPRRGVCAPSPLVGEGRGGGWEQVADYPTRRR